MYTLELPVLKPMLKLFPSVYTSQILWECVPTCWPVYAETATIKPIRPHAWDDEVILFC